MLGVSTPRRRRYGASYRVLPTLASALIPRSTRPDDILRLPGSLPKPREGIPSRGRRIPSRPKLFWSRPKIFSRPPKLISEAPKLFSSRSKLISRGSKLIWDCWKFLPAASKFGSDTSELLPEDLCQAWCRLDEVWQEAYRTGTSSSIPAPGFV